jgi:tetratricopeptide (TPR) repeat protein
MFKPFQNAKASERGGPTTATAKKETQRPVRNPPLPYYDWAKHVRKFGFFDHWTEHLDVSDAQEDAKEDPGSADKQEALADLLVCQTQHWGDAKVGFFFDSGGLFRAMKEAISLTSPDQASQLLRRQSKLAMCYEKRYTLKQDVNDLRSGILLAEHVVDQTPDSDPTKPFRLTCLANLLGHRFERGGDPNDGHGAVTYAAQAVELGERLESANDDAVARLRRTLAVLLEARSHRTGSLSDLEQAIQQTEQALERITASNPDRLAYIGEVGNMLVRKFQKSRDKRDLDSGITKMERAASAIPKGDAMLPRLLDNQSNGYLELYRQTGNMEVLALAVKKAEAAHKAQFIIDRTYTQSGKYFNSVVRMYEVQAQASQQLFDAGMMVAFAKRGIKDLKTGHPDKAEAIECLADAMALEFHIAARLRPEKREEFMNKAEGHYREVAGLENGHPFTRIRVCKKLGDLRSVNMDSDGAAEAYELAISLWPRLNPRTLAREDVEYVISQLSGLGPLAAYYICRSKKGRSASEALHALESGRGIIASLTIEVSDLKIEHGELYDRYTELCYIISSPLVRISHDGSSLSPAAAISRRNQQVKDLKLLEDQIRALPGFKTFPRTHSTTNFTKLASRGPIVCFSTTGDVTYAFLVTRDHVEVLQLEKIKHKDLQAHVKLLVRGKSPASVATSRRAENNERVRETLQWLWNCAVKPVLQRLKFIKKTSPERLPRIWWVTSGLLGLLPLHAAGSGWGTSTENTMSHVVSSYIPTLKALAYARKKQPRPLGDPGTELLVISVPEKKGYKKLKVGAEIDGVVKNFLPDTVKSSVLSMPSRKEALGNLKSTNIAHFICHGISEARSPSQGGLELADERLTIQDLSQLSLDQVQIAYLSACSTARNKNSEIVDESIAVASAFSLVGFPHVIGTLWEASDKIAQKIAPRFYKMLLEKKQERFSDNDAVAHAMHQATVSLWKDRTNAQERVDEWVPFIHLGA